jgi:hypothetical protein
MLLAEDWAADEEHARDIVRIVVAQPKSPVSWSNLKKLSGKPKSTFKRGLDEATKVKGWLIGLKDGYALNPDRSWEAALAPQMEQGPPGSKGPPLKGCGPIGPSGPDPLDPVGPSLDPGPNVGEETPSEPVENEVELEKADALLRKVL